MNKVLSILLVVAIAAGIVPYARGVGAPSPPPGIAAGKWVPMGESAGFVITGSGNDFRQGLKSEPHTMKGYFVIRIKESWLRVETAPDYETRPAAFTH
jgi:hypothetical protein